MKVARRFWAYRNREIFAWWYPPSVLENRMKRGFAGQSKDVICMNNSVWQFMKLSRSGPYHEASDEFRELTNLLIRSGEEEKHRLDDALEKILQNVEIIPIDLGIISDAITFQKSLDLSPRDSIVYASILAHLTTESGELRCFITKNSKDFANPDIEDQLTAHGCKLLTKFVNGWGISAVSCR